MLKLIQPSLKLNQPSVTLTYCIVVILLLFVVELWAPILYGYKVLLKILLMTLPMLWLGWHFFNRPNTRSLVFAIFLGIGSLIVIQVTYWALQQFIDLERIKVLLREQQGINASMFTLVAIYITFGNSLLEELFFRGFLANLNIKHPWVLSSALFAFYHLTIFILWFSWWVLLLALVGLFIGGLLFCWLNAAKNSIWNSWVMHIFADVAIVAIGFQMFGFWQ